MNQTLNITHLLKANHHHLSAILNRAEQAKKEAVRKENEKQQGA